MIENKKYITKEIGGNLIEVKFYEKEFLFKNETSGIEKTYSLSKILHCEVCENRKFKLRSKIRVLLGAFACSIILILAKIIGGSLGAEAGGNLYSFQYDSFFIDLIAGFIVGVPLTLWLDKKNKTYYWKNIAIEVTNKLSDDYIVLIEKTFSEEDPEYKEELQSAKQLCHEVNQEVENYKIRRMTKKATAPEK